VADFLTALRSGRVLLMDGAMGTELQKAGLGESERGERWNVRHPDRVQAIHRAYVEAGATVLLTNTFQVHRSAEWGGEPGTSLPWPHDECYGLPGLLWSAHALARAAGGPERIILADFGPMVVPPSGREFTDLKALARMLTATSRADAVLWETCSTPRARWAVRYAPGFTNKPVLLSLTYLRRNRNLSTASGHSPEWFAERASRWGAAALGVNCGRDTGMDEVIEIVRRYRKTTDLPLFARPNAGTPRQEGKRWAYPWTPKAMAARLPELLEAGVCMVGGCCGTTPAHIAAFRPVVDAWNKKRGFAR
jgi:methionine synthase I (cobalamin-dependent)